jgi:Fe-S cluster biosynthesis and repair protein YggX
MKPIKAKQLSRIQHLVPNNPQADQQITSGSYWDQEVIAREKKRTLYDSAYRTAQGHWKRRDEPDEAEQLRQSDRIRKHLLAKQQQASRDRLKKKGVVPTKQGKKLFDEFIKEANTHRPPKGKSIINTRDLNDLQNAYNAASALEFDKWVIFMNDLFSSRI